MTGDYNYEIFEKDIEKAEILLKAFTYDGTSTWGKGADKGYGVFLEALENIEFYDIETDSLPFKKGIYTLPATGKFSSPEDMFHKTYEETKKLLEMDKFLTCFGGEHSVSIGIMKAYYEKFKDLTIVQIDAHSDLRKSYNGSTYNHACAMHEVNKHCKIVQIGIRAIDNSELEFMDKSRVFFAQDIHKDNNWINGSLDLMSDNVYITFDIDALDPSIMPATGTPEPGGLMWYQTLDILKKVFQEKNVVGFDIVEFAPIDGLHFPQNVVANLYYKMLAYKMAYQS